MWKILKETGIPNHLTCLLRNLYAGQEATVRTLYLKLTDSKLGKKYDKAVYYNPIYLTYVQSTSCEKAELNESQAEINGRNINNLRYAHDTTLMAESEEELKSLLMGMKEESEKADLKLSIQKTKIMASGLITSW